MEIGRLVFPFLFKLFKMFNISIFYYFGRIASYNCIFWNIFYDNRSNSHNCSFANMYVATYDNIAS